LFIFIDKTDTYIDDYLTLSLIISTVNESKEDTKDSKSKQSSKRNKTISVMNAIGMETQQSSDAPTDPNLFSFNSEEYIQKILEIYNVEFNPDAVSVFIPVLLRNLKNGSLAQSITTVPTYPHPYMHLERQWDLGCWLHAISAIVGFPFPLEPIYNDTLAYALIAFQYLDDGDETALDHSSTDEIKIVRPPKIRPLTYERLRNSLRVFNNRMQLFHRGYTLIKEGMEIVSK
jgi:hypothetical protein